MRQQRLLGGIWVVVTVLVVGLATGPATARPIFVTGAGPGGGPHVQVFDAATGAPLFGFFAYAPTFLGGVRVSTTDVNGDGVPDVITAPGPGGGPHIRVFDGAALQAGQVVEIAGLFAYNPAFTGGVYIAAATAGCPPSMVLSGPTCIDKYEASVWETTNAAVIAKIKAGTVTLAELQAAGAIQRGAADNNYGTCPITGNGCVNVYAVSIPGVTPSRNLTWFQAAAAARNAGKRLLTNAEWQAAALGTPDGAPCIVAAVAPGLTGTAGCLSNVGAFDMSGNLQEWVADWLPRSDGICPGWGAFSNDLQCVSGALSNAPGGPGALVRGGFFANGGVFTVDGISTPASAGLTVGFRAAR